MGVTMIPVVSREEYLKRMLELPRACAGEVLAYYAGRLMLEAAA